MAILAGGLATRLRPLTNHIPKSLVPIHGEPFAVHQLRLLARNGVDQVVFCVGHLGEQIRGEIGREMFGIRISYVDDGATLMGTGGALQRASGVLGDAFLVLYGDSYLDCDYAGITAEFLDSRKLALMTVFRNEGQWERSNVHYENARIIDYHKNAVGPDYRYVDYGLGAFMAAVFRRYDVALPLDLSVVYRDLINADQLKAVEVPNRFFEVGSISGIRQLEQHLKGTGR